MRIERADGRMRRSVLAALIGIDATVLAVWAQGIQSETGVDALNYHRMASAIVQYGLAPWVVNPLSYVGIYPGSDSSGVPFLAAIFSLLSGTTISVTVLCYDVTLLLILGFGLFMLIRQLTGRSDLALAAVLMGCLAYGFATTLLWSLDERSFNVALAPVVLYLGLPTLHEATSRTRAPRYITLALVSTLMLIAHLSFLLLFPFTIIVPLFHEVLRPRLAARRLRRTSFLFFALIGLSPLVLLTTLQLFGLLDQFRLEYQLESSALFSGDSPLVFVANAAVFLATRVGPVNMGLATVGLVYLASRKYLISRNIVIGALLLTGFLGLPIVVYSKDLLTPIIVVLGALGLGALVRGSNRQKTVTVAIALAGIAAGSAAFNGWNFARTSTAAVTRYWTPLSVTPTAQDADLWIATRGSISACAYGNNAEVLQEVTNQPTVHFCTGLSIDFLINTGTSAVQGQPPFRVKYVGITGGSPSNWFSSPDFDQLATEFADVPSLGYQAGRALLLKYNVTWIVVSLVKPEEIPLFEYQGSVPSVFFTQLWADSYPVYRDGSIAVFDIGSGG